MFVLRKASRDNGTHTKRWKLNEKFADYFCARKHNSFGRFISIVAVPGGNRSVIMLPEFALNRGWGDVALKIANFMKDSKKTHLLQKNPERKIQKSYMLRPCGPASGNLKKFQNPL